MCVRVCLCEREDTVIVPLCCLMASIQFPQVSFFPQLSHCFKPSPFCLWETTGTVFLGTRLCLSLPQSLLFQPLLNCAIFQQELPLLSVALSLKLLQGEG